MTHKPDSETFGCLASFAAISCQTSTSVFAVVRTFFLKADTKRPLIQSNKGVNTIPNRIQPRTTIIQLYLTDERVPEHDDGVPHTSRGIVEGAQPCWFTTAKHCSAAEGSTERDRQRYLKDYSYCWSGCWKQRVAVLQHMGCRCLYEP